ncbi:hypothetical protein RirG_211330 [Rhizophagus irregularis DAOM 197198w]|uniref:Uncharacterized protein n=1 Tax=Rhizophagus irregularis (strain DAOM 197198w) TaxID=1432141 RepID=A0A015LQH0_RHIIW|nr:hypothetical protein RirG_211330 [Rhizophagus irregularis DAOM 197198w]
MSGNAKRGGRGGRQTRSSSCNSQAGGSRPTSPENQFTFSAPKETATHQESIWKTYQKKPQPTSDKKMTEAMEAERAMDMKKILFWTLMVQTPNLLLVTTKGKLLKSPKRSQKNCHVTLLYLRRIL